MNTLWLHLSMILTILCLEPFLHPKTAFVNGFKIKQIRAAFKKRDITGDGKLAFDEFVQILSDEFKHDSAVKDIFNALDLDGTGKISIEEFLEWMTWQHVTEKIFIKAIPVSI